MSLTNPDLVPTLTARVLVGFLAHHPVPVTALPGLVSVVARAFAALAPGAARPRPLAPATPAVDAPAVDPLKSVFPSHVKCLDCGVRLVTLRRHLNAAHGLSPAAYRARWKLPETYPMVAPNYTREQSRLAREMGLGKRHGRAR